MFSNSTKISLRDLSLQKKNKLRSNIVIPQLEIDMCQDCKSNNLVDLNGFLTCKNCGLISRKQIDSNVEWRCNNSNNSGVDKTRTSINDNKYVKGNTTNTTIGFNVTSKNCKNNNLIKTMSEWKQISYKDSSMITKIQHITNICKNNEINDKFVDDICEIFYKICSIKNPVRSKLKALMAASVQLCFIDKGLFKCDSVVSNMFDIDEKLYNKLFKDFELIWKELKRKESINTKELKKESIYYNTSYKNTQNNTTNLHSKKLNSYKHIITNTENNNVNITDNNKNNINNYDYILNNDNNKLVFYLKKCNIDNEYFDMFIDYNNKVYTNKILSNHIPRSRYAVIIYKVCMDNNIDCNKYNIIKNCRTSEVTFNKCFSKLN